MPRTGTGSSDIAALWGVLLAVAVLSATSAFGLRVARRREL
jgi:hypothetical protein